MENQDRKRIARRRFLKLLGLAAGLGIAIPADARYIEPHWIDVTRHTAHLPNLPLALDGMVVAQLTDLHHGHLTPESSIREAIQLAANAKPDLVVHTGDFVNRDPRDAALLAPLLAPLQSTRFGNYGCLGNHDYGDPEYSGNAVAHTMRTEGRIHLLRNASHRIAEGLYVAGIEDTCSGDPDPIKAFHGVPDDAAAIFLSHNPVGVFGAARRACLTLSGHTHGGQIRIPGLPPPRPCGMEGFPLMEGWGRFDQSWLYISRGVGMMMIPCRFRCRPEVTIFTLRRGDAAPAMERDEIYDGAEKAERFAKRSVHRIIEKASRLG